MRTTRVLGWAGVALAASLALVVAACGGSGTNKAGGDETPDEPVVLTMASATTPPPEQLQAFADEVKRLSGGTVRIEFRIKWRAGDPAVETGTIEDVRAGTIDLAWVGARIFDTLGVNDFQALVAPFVVDSHDLQQRVFEEGIPAQMLGGLEQLDLVGLGVLPGPMRALLGVTGPFTKPADFVGQTVGIQDSEVARLTFEALGATVKPVPAQAPLDGLDAYEQQLGSIVGNEYDLIADSVTAGINLWPRPLVIFTSQAAFEQLSASQQDALRNAAAAAIPNALAASRQEDADGAATLCGGGFPFVAPSEADLAAIKSAVQPVLDRIGADPTAGPYLGGIDALRAELPLSASAGAGACPEASPATEATGETTPTEAVGEPAAIDGVYEVTITRKDWIDAVELDEGAVPADLGDLELTLTLADGRFLLSAEPDGWDHLGTYSLEGDRLALQFAAEERTAQTWDLTWSLYRDELTLAAPADTTGTVSYWVGLKPWHRSGDASPDDLAVPPVSALPPDGVYRRTITVEEFLRTGATSEDALNNANTYVMTLRDGEVTGCNADGSFCEALSYRIDGDRVRFDWKNEGGEGLAFSGTWSLEGDGLRFTNIASAFGIFDAQFWAGGTWERVN